MARLPQPGGDSGNWGSILNDYLAQSHKADGTIKDSAVTATSLAPSSVTNAAIASDAVSKSHFSQSLRSEIDLKLDKMTADGFYAPQSLVSDVASLESVTGAIDLVRAAAISKKDSVPVVVVCLGSSTIAGTGATTPEDRFTWQLAARLQAAYPLASGASSPGTRTLAAAVGTPPSAPGVQFDTNGINGGVTSANYLTTTTVAQIKALNPTLIIHSIGANDWRNGVAPETFRANLLGWIAALDTANSTPHVHLLLQQHPRMDWTTPAYPWSAYATVLREIANENPTKIAHIDTTAAFTVTGIPESDPLDLIGSDNIHLTDAGHHYFAETVARLASFTPAVVAAPPVVVVPATVTTSDAFTGADESIVGRSSDSTLGGTPAAWGLLTNTAPYMITSGVLRRGSTAATQFGGLPHSSPDGSVTVKITAFPVGGDMWLDFRRVSLATSDTYRVTITSAGFAALSKRTGGSTTTLGVNTQLALNDILTLDCVGSTIALKRNGETIGTITDSSLSAAGYAGISVGSAVTDFGIDDFIIRAAS